MHESSRIALCGCIVLSISGVLVTLGCLLAIHLEATGLGAPRDVGMRPGYTALLSATAVAGSLVPAACLAVLRTCRRLAVAVAVSAAVVVSVAILGMIGIQQ